MDSFIKYLIIFLTTYFAILSIQANASDRIVLSEKDWKPAVLQAIKNGNNLNNYYVKHKSYDGIFEIPILIFSAKPNTGDSDITLKLIEHGYDLTKKDDSGLNVLNIGCITSLEEYPKIRLQAVKDIINAGEFDQPPYAVTCLRPKNIFDYIVGIQLNFDINKEYFGKPLFFRFLEEFEIEKFAQLSYLKPDYSLRDDDGDNIFHVLAETNYASEQAKKIRYLALQGANINARNNASLTPLMLATKAYSPNFEFIKTLVENGAIISLKALDERDYSFRQGETALDFIKRKVNSKNSSDSHKLIYRYLMEQQDKQLYNM